MRVNPFPRAPSSLFLRAKPTKRLRFRLNLSQNSRSRSLRQPEEKRSRLKKCLNVFAVSPEQSARSRGNSSRRNTTRGGRNLVVKEQAGCTRRDSHRFSRSYRLARETTGCRCEIKDGALPWVASALPFQNSVSHLLPDAGREGCYRCFLACQSWYRPWSVIENDAEPRVGANRPPAALRLSVSGCSTRSLRL